MCVKQLVQADKNKTSKPSMRIPLLDYLPLDKMVAILTDDSFRRIFVNERLIFWPSTGLDNGFASIRRKCIIWTNADQFSDAYMRH